ncbi:MAG: EAL domain-containing protein [Pseudomonas sp.]|uniref:EAL domain-containing protein n=1 Tax=Pseudomonas sp. TaxID=306 RepID=UPI00339320A8
MSVCLRLLLVLLSLYGGLGARTAMAELPLLDLRRLDLQHAVSVEHSRVLEDPAGSLQPALALQRLRQQGSPIEGSPRLGYSDSTWWVGFALQSAADEHLRLIIDHPFLEDLEVWLYRGDQVLAQLHSGSRLPFDARGEPYPHFMLRLPPLGEGPHSLLLRVKSHSSLNLPMQLIGGDQSTTVMARNWLQSGVVFGALLMMALFHLLKYSALRRPQLGFFCATALSVALYNAATQGIVGLLLQQWPRFPSVLADLSGSAMLIFSTLFICSALKLQERRLRWARNSLFTAILATALWAICGPYSHRAYALLNSLILLTGLFQLSLTLAAVWLQRPFARGFLACWGGAIMLMMLVPLSRAGAIATTPTLNYLHAYLPVISVFLFGLLNGKQLERIRQALLASQQQAIGNLEQYQALFRNAGEGILRCTRGGRVLEANPSFLRLWGGESKDLLETPLQQVFLGVGWTALSARLSAEQPTVSGECQLHSRGGGHCWVYLSLHLRPAQDCVEGIVVDLSERRALEERLQRLAAHDSLTGLLNRRELERLLQESLGASHPPFSHLLYLDLDQFKQVNDLCGHSAGDQLLRQLATHLQRQLPTTQAQLARIGGDEFAVMLGALDTDAALLQAETLRQAVEQFVFTWEGRPFRLGVSIGVLALSSGVADWETALNWADSAALLAKHQGRNRVHLFNPADGALREHRRQLQWTTRLRAALEQGHFALYFQSVVPLQGPSAGQHYEVLLRYRDPQSGEWVTPGQFLGAAERYGLLGAVDRWVIHHLLQWLAANPRHQRQLAQANVNLSAGSLLDPEFHLWLRAELERYPLAPGKLCIEVTEMVALGELAVSANWIAQLRERGLKVALDDFGSGFASYAYLRHLPLDTLKIDGSFIHGLEQDPINQAMVGSMQQIATQLGLKTVAEFVESQATLDCVRQLGVDYAQGYLIDRPRPLAELADTPTPVLNLDPSNS